MISWAKLSIKRPKSSIAIFLITGIALSLIGLGVSNSLSPTINVVPGTQSSRAQQLGNAQFGPTQLVPILLVGPKAQLNREGPPLVAALAKRPHTRVMSAWDAGSAAASLRPKPTAAMIIVSVDRSEKNAVKYDQPQIENLVAHKITGPVKPYVTGQPSIDRAEKDASLSNLRRDEAIAVGILFLLLLVGLRAPIAALLVTAVGGISMLAGFGEVALLGHIFSLDPVGVAAGTMTGLAVAVAFALLILDRFHREEYPPGGDPRDAATAALRGLETTGKAVLVAGTALVVGLGLVAVIGPTQLMVSVGTGALTCALFAVGGAVVVMPAALVLLGRKIDWLSFPAPAFLQRAWSGLVDGGNWVTRYAVFAGFAATALLAAIAVPAFALNTGPTDISQLPSNSKAVIAFRQVSRVMGPGWATPFNLIVVSNNLPLTTPKNLASLSKFQVQIAQNKTVYSVTGPGAIAPTSNQLSTFGTQLYHSAAVSEKSKKDLVQLINGLGQAGSGSAQLQSGLAAASSGAGQLQSGGGQAGSGAGQLHAGLAQARSGSAQLAAGLNQALSGANALKSGAGQALSGANQLASGLGKGAPQVTAGLPAVGALASSSAAASSEINALKGQVANAQNETANALSTLQAACSDKSAPPGCQSAISSLSSVSSSLNGITGGLNTAYGNAAGAAGLAAAVKSQVNTLAPQLTAAAAGASQLAAGIAQLHNGNSQLASGLSQLSGGGGQLVGGLDQLTAGAGALQIGLGQLTGGAGQLASGLSGGVGPAGQLTTGLGTMQAAVVKSRGQIPSTAQLRQLQREAPGIFNSGYFVLAAVEGATTANRTEASFTINLLRGGTAGQILVVSKYPSSDPRTAALGTQLATLANRYAKANHLQVAVGGPAGGLGDVARVTKSRIWLDVAVVSLAIMLTLAIALRAVLLPAVAVVFGLLATASTFGLLQVLFGGSNPPLGGPGYLDPITVISVFTIAFSITVVFSTILLMRTREAYVADPDNRSAVRTGLRETAAASTGAGLVMVAAVIPFAITDLLNVRALGIGVAFAVLLDVLIVRPVLLPAAEAVLGRYGWWPTRGPARPTEPEPPTAETRRMPRPRMPHRKPRPAH
jgi:putative drug exporter of the RND superfamily